MVANGYDSPTIQVLVHGSQGGKKVITCKADQHTFVSPEGVDVHFELRDVGPIWCKRGLFWGWRQGVEWRAGTLNAMHRDPVYGDYLPPMSQGKIKQFVAREVANSLGKPKKAIETWQFWVLFAVLVVIAVMSALTVFGIHLSASQAHQVAQSLPTPSPSAIPVLP
jgi:hypothetical protein